MCTDNNCPVHDPRAAARKAEHPEPVMPPAPPAETEEEAEARRQQHEQQRKECDAERERRAEEFRQQREREQQQYEGEQARGDEQRKARTAIFERILENAPETLNAAQLRVLLRAIVNLDPYTFADDLTVGDDENDRRNAEEVLLSTIDSTTDDKLTCFAIRLTLSGHVGIPRENELDFLTEAEAVFAPPQKEKAKRTRNAPVAMPTPKTPAKKAAKKQVAA